MVTIRAPGISAPWRSLTLEAQDLGRMVVVSKRRPTMASISGSGTWPSRTALPATRSMTGKESLTSEASMRGVVKEGREAGPLAEGSGSGQLDDLVLTVGVERRAREERHAGRSQRGSQLR